ncbi:MAG TPA: AmmeMemoRadiSam system protein A, partial [Spirochaetota bacterium]|nr:AmmeMemoRadiSam system protein A [Spirochaetota bacterium]
LRGCIGYIQPLKPLFQAVIDNAYNAAFRDSRFQPVTEKELEELEIEISVLTVPRPLQFKDKQELLRKLEPRRHGVILQLHGRSATYLPQVWEQLPQKTAFLKYLCRKAGLSSDAWHNENVTIKTYEAYVFSEEDSEH